MSDKENLNQRQILNDALKDSFRKMLDLKRKLGQPVVTGDGNGKPIVITAEEAEALVYGEQD